MTDNSKGNPVSKFKVGDRVLHEDRGEGVVVELGHELQRAAVVAVEYEDGLSLGELEDRLTALTAPSVPDADGNPIVVGQLVESVMAGELAWVDDLRAGGEEPEVIKVRAGGVSWGGRGQDWRVVTDTIRTPDVVTSQDYRNGWADGERWVLDHLDDYERTVPEPETRDVVLRVTVENWPNERAASVARGVMADAARAAFGKLTRWPDLTTTVEVVE